MYDHITLRVKDVDASSGFYRALLEPLGHVQDPSGGIGPKGAPALWLVAHAAPNGGVHVAFSAKDRKAVDAFHAAGLGAGARDNGKPGPRPDYGPTYYAAFLIDLDGNNVEAVCMA